MTDPIVRRSRVRTILLAVKAWLVEQEVADESRILIVARDSRDVPHFQGDQDIVLRPGRLQSLGYEEGSGRYDKRVKRRLEATIRTRLELDEADSDEQWLTREDAHTDLEEDVVAALELFPVEEADGDLLLVEPMRLISGDVPGKRASAKGWGESTLVFEMVYALPLDEITDAIGGGGAGGGGGGGSSSATVTAWYGGWYFG